MVSAAAAIDHGRRRRVTHTRMYKSGAAGHRIDVLVRMTEAAR